MDVKVYISTGDFQRYISEPTALLREDTEVVCNLFPINEFLVEIKVNVEQVYFAQGQYHLKLQ